MNKAARDIVNAKLARVKHAQAENLAKGAQLLAEEARLYDELAEGEAVDLHITPRGRTKYRARVEPENITAEEVATANAQLRKIALRARVNR